MDLLRVNLRLANISCLNYPCVHVILQVLCYISRSLIGLLCLSFIVIPSEDGAPWAEQDKLPASSHSDHNPNLPPVAVTIEVPKDDGKLALPREEYQKIRNRQRKQELRQDPLFRYQYVITVPAVRY